MRYVILIFLLMPTAVSAQSFTDWSGWKISSVHKNLVIAQLSANLTDPSSAQLRSVHLMADKKTLCGEVNAKNQMGGYVGYRWFTIDTSQSGSLIIANPKIKEFYKSECLKQ